MQYNTFIAIDQIHEMDIFNYIFFNKTWTADFDIMTFILFIGPYYISSTIL